MTRKRVAYEPMEPEYFSETLHQWSGLDDGDVRLMLFALLDYLKLDAVKTNRTKHGDVQIIVREPEDD